MYLTYEELVGIALWGFVRQTGSSLAEICVGGSVGCRIETFRYIASGAFNPSSPGIPWHPFLVSRNLKEKTLMY